MCNSQRNHSYCEYFLSQKCISIVKVVFNISFLFFSAFHLVFVTNPNILPQKGMGEKEGVIKKGSWDYRLKSISTWNHETLELEGTSDSI
jgi:hypothetical protein